MVSQWLHAALHNGFPISTRSIITYNLNFADAGATISAMLEQFDYRCEKGMTPNILIPGTHISFFNADVMNGEEKIARLWAESWADKPDSLYIGRLKIESAYREQGIGHELMSMMLDWAYTTPVAVVYLIIDVDRGESSAVTQNWFEKHFGFYHSSYDEKGNPILSLPIK